MKIKCSNRSKPLSQPFIDTFCMPELQLLMSTLIGKFPKTYCYFILRAACVLARKESRELFGDLGNRENGFRLTLGPCLFDMHLSEASEDYSLPFILWPRSKCEVAK